MFKYYPSTVRYQSTGRRGPQLNFSPALRAQSSPSLWPDLCCSGMQLIYQKGWRWSRTTALTPVLRGPLPFKGRMENQTIPFLPPCPWSGQGSRQMPRAAYTPACLALPGWAWTPAPRPQAHLSSAGGENYAAPNRIPTWGLPHLSTVNVHLVLTSQQGDAETKACASVQHY